MWTLVAIFAIVSSTDLWGSLPWTDHCFVHHICSLVAQLSFVDHCFGCLFCQSVPALATRHRNWFTLGSDQVSFPTEVPSVWWWWLVATRRAGSFWQGCHRTSLLYLVILQCPQPLRAPVPKLINRQNQEEILTRREKVMQIQIKQDSTSKFLRTAWMSLTESNASKVSWFSWLARAKC